MDFGQILGLVKDPQVQQMFGSLLRGSGGGQAGSGGIQDLLGKLTGGGLQNQLNSWVGTGQNMPVSTQQIESAFGSDTIHQLAQSAGLTDTQAASDLAQRLPEIINEATPQGTLAGLTR